jgi:hypothetical protein
MIASTSDPYTARINEVPAFALAPCALLGNVALRFCRTQLLWVFARSHSN